MQTLVTKRYPCPRCGKAKFKSESAMRSHLKSRKCKNRLVKCRVCKMKMPQRELTLHQAIHPTCELCQKRFRSEGGVHQHVIDEHYKKYAVKDENLSHSPAHAGTHAGKASENLHHASSSEITPPGPAASDRSYACVPQPKLEDTTSEELEDGAEIELHLTEDVTDPDATPTPTSFSCSKCEQSVHPIKFPCGHISMCQSCIIIDILSRGLVQCASCESEVLRRVENNVVGL